MLCFVGDLFFVEAAVNVLIWQFFRTCYSRPRASRFLCSGKWPSGSGDENGSCRIQDDRIRIYFFFSNFCCLILFFLDDDIETITLREVPTEHTSKGFLDLQEVGRLISWRIFLSFLFFSLFLIMYLTHYIYPRMRKGICWSIERFDAKPDNWITRQVSQSIRV